MVKPQKPQKPHTHTSHKSHKARLEYKKKQKKYPSETKGKSMENRTFFDMQKNIGEFVLHK
jgi:hypothetical protein